MQRLLLGTAVDEPHLPIVVQNRPRAVGHRRGEPPAHARTGKAHEAAELPDSGNAGEGLRFPRADGEWSGLRGKPPRPHAGQRCGVRVPQHGNASAGERDPTRRTPRPPPRPGPASRHLGWRGLVWGRPALVDGWSPYLDASRRKAAVADAHAGVRDDRPEPAGLCSGSRRPITTSSRRRRSQGREPASFGDRYVPMPTSFPSRPATPRRRPLAYAVARDQPWLAGPIWLLAGAVAHSRVHTGDHCPSDVVLGFVLGVGTAAMATSRESGLRGPRLTQARADVAQARGR